jgi:hypothetical protein
MFRNQVRFLVFHAVFEPLLPQPLNAPPAPHHFLSSFCSQSQIASPTAYFLELVFIFRVYLRIAAFLCRYLVLVFRRAIATSRSYLMVLALRSR